MASAEPSEAAAREAMALRNLGGGLGPEEGVESFAGQRRTGVGHGRECNNASERRGHTMRRGAQASPRRATTRAAR
jgi:hypothetical protein